MILKTKIAAFPDNDMIDQGNADHAAGLRELMSEFPVGKGRRHIITWMVVGNQDARSFHEDGLAQDLIDSDRRRIAVALIHDFRFNDGVAGIEIDDEKLFLHAKAQIEAKPVDNLVGRTEFRLRDAVDPAQPSCDFQYRHQFQSLGILDPLDRNQFFIGQGRQVAEAVGRIDDLLRQLKYVFILIGTFNDQSQKFIVAEGIDPVSQSLLTRHHPIFHSGNAAFPVLRSSSAMNNCRQLPKGYISEDFK